MRGAVHGYLTLVVVVLPKQQLPCHHVDQKPSAFSSTTPSMLEMPATSASINDQNLKYQNHTLTRVFTSFTQTNKRFRARPCPAFLNETKNYNFCVNDIIISLSTHSPMQVKYSTDKIIDDLMVTFIGLTRFSISYFLL